MASLKSPTPLYALSDQILDLITWYLHGECLFSLLWTGDKALRRKMSHSTRLSVWWKHPSYCDWDRCLPFIESFSRLTELSIRSSSMYHLSSKPLNPRTLPSHLTLLELQFRGALDLLIDYPQANTFAKCFPSLRTLSLSQGFNVRDTTDPIRLTDLPPALEHLILFSTDPNAHYEYLVDDIQHLPDDLCTFDVAFPALHPWKPAPNAPHTDFFVHFKALSQLSSLSTIAPEGYIIDITHVASTLRHLKVRGIVSYEYQPIFVDVNNPIDIGPNWDWWAKRTSANIKENLKLFKDRTLPPIRSILPKLQSLELPDAVLLSWDCFASLPLSMTRLRGNFGQTERTKQICEQLNQTYLQTQGEDRPAAPIMFREFRIPFTEIGDLDWYRRVETLNLTNYVHGVHVTSIPRRVRTLDVSYLEGDLALLPPSLTSLTCGSVEPIIPEDSDTDITSKQMIQEPKMRSFWPPLVNLNLQLTILSPELVSLFPSTLERLTVLLVSEAPLEALKRRVDLTAELPRLASLHILIFRTREQEPLVLSMRCIPSTLTRLSFNGRSTFPPGSSVDSLRNHPKLTDLEAIYQHPEEILGQLPQQLLRLTLTLTEPINLNKPSIVNDLLSMPPNLRYLSIDSVPTNMAWFIPASPTSLTLWTRLQFSAKHRSLFGLMLLLPGRFWSNRLALALSENFFYSVCLPASLVELHAHISQEPLVKEGLWAQIALIPELRLSNPWDDLKRFLFGRLPPLRLLTGSDIEDTSISAVTTLSETYFRQKRVTIVPPQLSFFNTRGDVWRSQHLRYALTGVSHELSTPPEPAEADYMALMGLHATNIFAWSYMAWHFSPQTRTLPIIWLCQWFNIIGSALAIPILWRRRRRTMRNAQPVLRRNVTYPAIGVYMFVQLISIWVTYDSAITALGYAPKIRWSPYGHALFGFSAMASIFGDCFSYIFFRL